jgi:hypothetical protein
MVEAGGAHAPPHGSPVLNWQADPRLAQRLAALNTSGRHITNLTNINGTTYADVEVRPSVLARGQPARAFAALPWASQTRCAALQ